MIHPPAPADLEQRTEPGCDSTLTREAALLRLEALRSTWRRGFEDQECFEAVAESFRSWAEERRLPKVTGILKSMMREILADIGPDTLDATTGRFESLAADLLKAVMDLSPEKTGVLVVDPNPAYAGEIAASLMSPARVVHSARNAAEAREVLSRNPISLILMDMDQEIGVEDFLQEFRAKSVPGTCSILAYAFPESPLAGLPFLVFGADRFLPKPLSAAALNRAALEELWRLAHSAERSPVGGQDEVEDVREEAPDDPGPPVSLWPKQNSEVSSQLDEAEAVIQRSVKQKKKPVSISVLEFDRIPSLKRTLGTEVCDQIISRALFALSGSLRRSDSIANWKDGLNVVVLAGTTETEAVQALQGALQSLRAQEFDLPDGRSVRLTFSAGVVTLGKSKSVAEPLLEARKYAGIASTNGGNCIVSKVSTVEGNTILVAEDDPVTARIIRHRLEREGFDIIHFTDGQSALRGAMESAWICAILDVRMPELDGLEILNRLRQHPVHASKPVIMLSSLAGEKDIVKAFKHGASDYVTKPFSPAELCARLDRLLRRNSHEPELTATPRSRD